MKTILLTIVSLIAFAFARDAQAEPTVNQLVGLIRSNLPKGWSVTYESEYKVLDVTRDEPVIHTVIVPSGTFEHKSWRDQFSFAFRVMDYVPPAEFQRLNAENKKVQKELRILYDDLQQKGVMGKGDSFIVTNDSQKPGVEQYKELKSTLHRLPDLYFQDISLEWIRNAPGDYFGMRIDDYRIRKECEGVRDKVAKLLSVYRKK